MANILKKWSNSELTFMLLNTIKEKYNLEQKLSDNEKELNVLMEEMKSREIEIPEIVNYVLSA